MAFTALSYNLLATAYIHRAWYSRTPALVLDPAWRVPALVQRIADINADLFCLQEVEPETFVALRTFLGERNYGAVYARKLARRPEGLVIFYRRAVFESVSARVIVYADGAGVEADTGYVAQLVLLRYAGKILGVINTHLTWDPPSTPILQQRGLRQMRQLIAQYHACVGDAGAWIIGGDFNVTPESESVEIALRAGMQYSHHNLADVYTCNIGGRARLIDYLFYSAGLSAEALVLSRVDDRTILPSAEEPSDHVPIMARFDWRD